MVSQTSKDLIARYRTGQGQAADEIFDRYLRRLIELARLRISPKLARRIDPEDVVQSAYRSFFIHARDGKFVLKRAGDLWRLLAGITLHKVQGQIERHTAGRRDIGKEEDIGLGRPAADEPTASEPTPDEAAAVAEQLELFMQRLSPIERRVIELRLQGRAICEIADSVDRSQRTVRRLIDGARGMLESELRGH